MNLSDMDRERLRKAMAGEVTRLMHQLDNALTHDPKNIVRDYQGRGDAGANARALLRLSDQVTTRIWTAVNELNHALKLYDDLARRVVQVDPS